MSAKVKACWFCPHFNYSSGDRGYSEMTPGYDFSMRCGKNLWEFDPYMTSQEEFGEYLMKANTCKFYRNKEDKKNG